MERRKELKGQEGFTLIEIIAVLIILGILAAVAVPKYFDLQTEAQTKSVEGALGGLKSAVTMCYAQQTLAAGASKLDLTKCDGEDFTKNIGLGDFNGTASDSSGTITVTVTSGPSWFAASSATKTKSFTLY